MGSCMELSLVTVTGENHQIKSLYFYLLLSLYLLSVVSVSDTYFQIFVSYSKYWK